MKLSIKRCLFSFVMSTALAGTVRAQSESAEGVVRLGNNASSAAAPAVQADPTMEGYVTPYSSPYGASAAQYGGGGGSSQYFGQTEVDRVFRVRGRVDARGGQLYGYGEGYTNVGLFAPLALADENSLIFADVRAMVTNRGKGGANAGVGLRHYDESLDRVFGASVWYDYDNGHVDSYQQIGISLESLGRFADWRVNGYIPIGNDKNALSVVYPTSFFSGHNLLISQLTTWEQAYHGFDTEIGGPFPVLGRYGLNGYVGFYYFTGPNTSDFTGVSGRIQAQLNEDLTLGVTVTDDHTFGTNTQIQVVATLPDGTPNRWLRPLRVYDRMFQPVNRNYRAIVNTVYSTQQILAINPKDDEPYFVDHINPNVGGPGDGTIENPYSSVANYINLETGKPGVDIIYVRPRNDGSSVNLDSAAGGANGLELYTNQRLLSSTTPHTVPTQFGLVPLGGYSAGTAPTLANSSGGNVVTLRDGAVMMEVSGFTIAGSDTGNGLYGSNNQMVLINNNTFQNGLNGVLLDNLSGLAAGGSLINDNNFSGNVENGFRLTNNATPALDIQILDNVATNNGNNGIQLDSDAGSVINGLISGNTAESNGNDGIALTATGGTLNFASAPDQQISDNLLNNNVGDGLSVDIGQGGTGNFFITNNTATGNENGFRLGKTGTGDLNVEMTLNTLTGNTADGARIDGSGTAAPVATILSYDNLYSTNSENGLSFHTSGDATVSFTSSRDLFTDNTVNGINVETLTTSQVDLNLQNATVTGNGNNGLNTLISDVSLLNLTVTSPLDPLFAGTGSLFSNNGDPTAGVGNGVGIAADRQGVVNATFSDTLFTDNVLDGLNFNRMEQARIIATVANSEVTGNGDDGIEFQVHGSDPFVPPDAQLPLGPSRLTLNTVLVDSNGLIRPDLQGGNGLEVQTYDDAALVVNASETFFTNNAANGVLAVSLDHSNFGMASDRSTFDGVTITDNGNDGIKLFAMGMFESRPEQFVEISSDLAPTIISENGDDGIQASMPYGNVDVIVRGQAPVSGFTTLIQQNVDNGIEFNVADVALDGDDTNLINRFFANGIEFNDFSNFNGIGNLTVQNVAVGDDNLNDALDAGNGGNGIELYNSNSDTFQNRATAAGNSVFYIFHLAGSMTLNVDNSLIAGNNEDGINMTGDGTNDSFGAGNIFDATVTNSQISDNGGSGIDITLEGKHGEYTFGFFFNPTYDVISANNFDFENNLILRNHDYGVRFESNAGNMLRDNLNFAGRQNFWGLDFQDGVQPTTPPGPFNIPPLITSVAGGIYNFNDGSAGIALSDYYSIATDSNSRMTFLGNQVLNNGTPNQQFGEGGDGMFLRISTNSFLSADIGGAAGNAAAGNLFSGNEYADVRIESFVATDITTPEQTSLAAVLLPPQSTAAAAPTADRIWLDDTAQLDLRFNNNTGRELNANFITVVGDAGRRAAVYENFDIFKGGAFRATQLFQLDNAFNVNTSNSFSNVNLFNEFSGSGNFYMSPVADPLFPNSDFPENASEDPGNPFTP